MPVLKEHPHLALRWLLPSLSCTNCSLSTLEMQKQKTLLGKHLTGTNNFDYNYREFKARKILRLAILCRALCSWTQEEIWKKPPPLLLLLHLRPTHITASAQPPMSVWKSTVAGVFSFMLLLHNVMPEPIYILHVAERSRGGGRLGVGGVQKLPYSCLTHGSILGSPAKLLVL